MKKRQGFANYRAPQKTFQHKMYLQVWKLTQFLLFNIPIDVLNAFRLVALRSFGASIGSGVVIRPSVRVYNPRNLHIEDDVWVGEGAWIYNYDRVTIQRAAVVSQEVIICTASHDYRSEYFETISEPIVIRSEGWLCLRAIVLPGVITAQGEIVPANSVRRKN